MQYRSTTEPSQGKTIDRTERVKLTRYTNILLKTRNRDDYAGRPETTDAMYNTTCILTIHAPSSIHGERTQLSTTCLILPV
jgi:hypothetical protein